MRGLSSTVQAWLASQYGVGPVHTPVVQDLTASSVAVEAYSEAAQVVTPREDVQDQFPRGNAFTPSVLAKKSADEQVLLGMGPFPLLAFMCCSR